MKKSFQIEFIPLDWNYPEFMGMSVVSWKNIWTKAKMWFVCHDKRREREKKEKLTFFHSSFLIRFFFWYVFYFFSLSSFFLFIRENKFTFIFTFPLIFNQYWLNCVYFIFGKRKFSSRTFGIILPRKLLRGNSNRNSKDICNLGIRNENSVLNFVRYNMYGGETLFL